MRLYEITSPTLYLCTVTPQKEGSTVKMEEPCSRLGAAIETALEARRPADRLPRARSLMLSTKPLGTEYTYIVQPERLERQHTGWLKKLAETDPSQAGVMAHYANGYWSGKECAEARGEPWEYRASAARVLERQGRSPRT